jgi:hypothetical protein
MLVSGCAGEDTDVDSGAVGTSTDTDASATEGPGDSTGEDTEEEAPGTTGACEPEAAPERFIVFGDSILACSTINGGKSGEDCSARIVHEYLDEHVAPGITYENHAVGGARTADIIGQMAGVDATASGPAIVLLGIGGNDLQPFLLMSDDQAMDAFDDLSQSLDESWDEILDWLYDDAHFPDGFTLVVDNQYNPFDDCTADPYSFMSPLKTELLGVFNDRIDERLESHDNAHVSDLYLAFLGHGHHWQTEGCPHTQEGNEYWMIGGVDLIHPGVEGHAGIAVEVESVLDGLLACD